MRSRFFKPFTAARTFIGKIRPERVMFFGGISLIAVGASLRSIPAGLITAGILMLLSLKPLMGWVK